MCSVKYTLQSFNEIKPLSPILKAVFFVMHLYISNDIDSAKMYDKRDYFDFQIVNFYPFC